MTIDEIMKYYEDLIDGRADEKTIKFSEILVDNYGSPTEDEGYREKYESLLREYQNRFFTREASPETEDVTEETEKTEEIKDYDDLFKEEK